MLWPALLRLPLLWWLSLLGASLATEEANDFKCFDTPQTTADRSNLTITIGRLTWVSHNLVDSVAELVLRELLGYTVRRAQLADSRSFGPALGSAFADTDLEQWTSPFGDVQYRDYVSITRQVYDLGTIGYVGRSGLWTLRTAVQQHKFADYYKFYLNETAATAAGFLSFGASGDTPGESYCEPDPKATWCNGSVIEGYWATSSCRASPDSCLLISHMTTHYDRGYFEQLVRNNHINAVFGYYGESFLSRIRSFAGQPRFPLFYWWQPTPLLIELDAVRVSFPDYFTGCDVKLGQPGLREDAEGGTVSCDYVSKTLWKAVSARVRESLPEAFFFFTEFLVTAEQMDSLLRATLEAGASEVRGDSVDAELQIACDFMKQNMALFKTFAPDCITHPPSPVRNGDLVFDPDSLECVRQTVFLPIGKTSCFADAQRPGIADRSDRTITLVRRDWATHDIVSMVTEVILRDYLGFTVEPVYNNRTDQIQAPLEIMQGNYDADMEVWLPSYWELNAELFSPYLDPLVTGEVELVGFTGFSGRSGLFISREALRRNALLDFYKAYQNASEVQGIGIALHVDTRLKQLLGDDFPVCDHGIWDWCGTGDIKGFWAPPMCQAEPDRCIEIVHTFPDRAQGVVEQLVRNLGLEAVVAYYGDSAAYSLISQAGTGKASPFYWWEPDPLLLTLDAVRISFPDFYFGCTAGDTLSPAGNVSCDFPSSDLRKVVSASLRATAPEAFYALVHLELLLEMVNSVLATQQSKTLNEAVCEWMAANPTQIEVWTPSCLVAPLPPDAVRAGDLVFDTEEMQCKPLVCPTNAVLRYVTDSRTFYCDPCEEGAVPNEWQTLCELCPAGQEVNGTSGRCSPCDPGKVKAAEGKICESCADGRFMPHSGQSACIFCNSTSYQDQRGALDCKLCEDVVIGSVTPILGATSSSYCHCRKGTYLPLNASQCEECPEGMECLEGADAGNLPISAQEEGMPLGPYPQAREGFMTIPGEPFQVYECLIQEHCPGGAPGSCSHLRDSTSVACGRCVDNAYATEGGCERCKSLDVVPLIVAILVGLTVAVGVAIVTNRNLLMKSSVVLMAVMMAGIAVTTLQTLTVFKQISVDWFEPFSSIFRALKIISFDMELLRTGCVMGNDEVRQYTFRQLVAPVCLGLLLVTMSIKKRFNPQMVVVNEFVNTVGTLFNIFFISIIISCVSPLVCYPHPGSSGRSVVGNPATLCNFQDDHAYVVTTGFIASLCVPVPFLALVGFGIKCYPRYVRSTLDAQWFLASYRFLFMRFHPSAYYFGAVIVARGVCCCLVPVVLDQPGVQVIVMSFIISTYVLVQQQLQPWRAKLANIVDGLLGFLLLLILLCLAVLTDLNGTQAVPAVATVGFATALITPAAMTAYTWFRKSFRHSYHMFICHHKADAAAQARLLKMLLTAMTGKRIFIDSDDLVELDKLFGIIKTRVKLLLVYLTKDTLRRPWCAGEITTNWACNGRVATIKTPSFVQPTEQEASELYLLVDTTSCNLQEQGIMQESMALALAKVVTAPAIVMNPDVKGSRRFLMVTECVVQNDWDHGKQLPSPNSRSFRFSPSVGAVVLHADADDDEAVASTSILGKKIEMQVHSYVEGGVTNLLDVLETEPLIELQHVDASRACVVLLSRGSLERMMQLAIIVRGMSSPCTCMIPVTLWDFKFPAPNFYPDGLPEMWLEAVGSTAEEAQAQVRAFFNLIAIVFSTMSNDGILDTQSMQVVERVPRSFEKPKVSRLRTSSSSTNLSMTSLQLRQASSQGSRASRAQSSPQIREADASGACGSDGEEEIVSRL